MTYLNLNNFAELKINTDQNNATLIRYPTSVWILRDTADDRKAFRQRRGNVLVNLYAFFFLRYKTKRSVVLFESYVKIFFISFEN